mmetsp:Transcript_83828/g.233860  ORF Transcript_83828/g.233860 Transcript_83828/m.233860 type:complete len:246 (+) Transcript_83828:208-945(+)
MASLPPPRAEVGAGSGAGSGVAAAHIAGTPMGASCARAKPSTQAAPVPRSSSLAEMLKPTEPQSKSSGRFSVVTELSTNRMGSLPWLSFGWPNGGHTNVGKPVSAAMSFSFRCLIADWVCTARATRSTSTRIGCGTTVRILRPSASQASVCMNCPCRVKWWLKRRYWSQAGSCLSCSARAAAGGAVAVVASLPLLSAGALASASFSVAFGRSATFSVALGKPAAFVAALALASFCMPCSLYLMLR